MDTVLDNERTKLKNQVVMYRQLIGKLHEEISELERDKFKYAKAAGDANQQYYDSLEQVKVKTSLITKLQKKNLEIEAKLKASQNLYETGRADRNLYCKNVNEMQEEIEALRMRFKRMLAQISTLKEEIMSKEESIIRTTKQKNELQDKNTKLGEDIKKISDNISASEKMIKTQDADIARLKYVILEAEAEKQK